MTDAHEEPRLPPLYCAAAANDLAEVRRLLESGADPNEGTPLFFLAGHTNDEDGNAPWHKGMAYLLDQGADPNVTSENAMTPLHQIVSTLGTLATVRLLLDRGANPFAKSGDGLTPYAVAIRMGNIDAARLIAERGGATPLTPADEFVGACRVGDEPRARELMGRDPALRELLDKEVAFAGTLLHWTAWTAQTAGTRALIALGADVNRRDSQFGSSPLGWAGHGSTNCRQADDEYCAIVDLLRAAGATREASINSGGETPESMATPRVAERLTRAL